MRYKNYRHNSFHIEPLLNLKENYFAAAASGKVLKLI
jgi:hypothetical protein